MTFFLVMTLCTDHETGKGVTGEEEILREWEQGEVSTSILVTDRGLFVAISNQESRGMEQWGRGRMNKNIQ